MHILVAEDDAVLRAGLGELLERAGHTVALVADGAAADLALVDGHHDLLLLDLGLPKVDGLSVLRRLRRRGHTLAVLVLSARDRIEDRVAGLDAGADDYLDKPFDRTELEARIRALQRRRAGGRLRMGRLEWSAESGQAWIDGQDLGLTRNDSLVLQALLQPAGRLVTKDALARRLAVDHQEASGNAVEVYIYRLRNRLKGSDLSIRTVRGLGYLIEDASVGGGRAATDDPAATDR